MLGTARYMTNSIRAPDNLSRNYIIKADGKKYYNAKASAHFITSRSGETIRLVKDDRAAWHAGSSSTTPKFNGRGSLNLWTIGHEICNWGPLILTDEGYMTSGNGWTHKYDGPPPLRRTEYHPASIKYEYKDGEKVFPSGFIDYWEPYPQIQLDAVAELWAELIERYDIEREFITGHQYVDPGRKIDPGPAFPLEEIINSAWLKVKSNYMINPTVAASDVEIESNRIKSSRHHVGFCATILSKFLS